MGSDIDGVNTKKAERRELKFNCTSCLKKELDAIEASHRAGTLTTTGNWTAAQCFEHCARTWNAAIDGFPETFKPPAPIKWAAKLFFKKKAISGQTAPAGIKPPKAVTDALEVGRDADFDEALAHLRAEIARTDAGEQFAKPSPLFGQLSHDEWLNLQLGHCQSHLGFLKPG
ncbi:MAG: DUF1569 domain-containing protein [Phycisphaerales bacterium]